MKKLILILMLVLLTSCLTTKPNVRHQRYNCVRNLVEIKVPAESAINFCSKNFQIEVE